MTALINDHEKSVKVKNLLIENLTIENEKIKSDMNTIISSKHENLKNLKYSLNQKDAQIE